MRTNKRILYEGRFLRLAEIEVVSPKGFLFRWEIVERLNAKGIVVIVPVKETPIGSFFIFIRHWRAPLQAWVMEFPAGLNEKDESLEATALRELREETGYLANRLIHLGTFPASSGISSERLDCYLATELVQTGEREQDPLEELEVLEVSLKEVKDFLQKAQVRGDLVDLKVYGLIELTLNYLKA